MTKRYVIVTASPGIGAGGAVPLDVFLYLGGIREAGAFTAGYSFDDGPREATGAVLVINLIAPILLAQSLAHNLAPSGRVVLMGSLSGLDSFEPREVANAASRFGLRGADGDDGGHARALVHPRISARQQGAIR